MKNYINKNINTTIKWSREQEKDMKNAKKLKLVEEILCESDLATDIDMDIAKKRKVSKREKEAAELLNLIYRIIHSCKSCPHPDWEKEAEDIYNKLF